MAPGRYQASLPVQDDGVYLVQASQPDGNGGTATESGGFVVPYSPEYKAGGVNQSLLDNLSKRTGGQTIHDPSEAFVHDLPAVGAPRPLWPWLLAMTALLLVMDVGVRRVRVTGPEMRGAYYAVRRRLGYVDELQERTRLAPRPAPLVQTPSLVGGSPKPGAAPVAKVVRPAAAEATRPSRLLAAKQRASRR